MNPDPRHVDRDMTLGDVLVHFVCIYGSKAYAQYDQFRKWINGQAMTSNERGELVCFRDDINAFIDGN